MSKPAATLTLLSSSTELHSWIVGRLESLPPDLSRRAAVVLPSLRVAHQIRRQLCVDGRCGLLAGVQFLSAGTLAYEVLIRAGSLREGRLSELRPIALRALFKEGRAGDLGLSYFKPDQLERNRGYAEAVTATIGDLEEAGLIPADLTQTADAWSRKTRDSDRVLAARRIRDVATFWEAVDQDLRVDNPDLCSTPELLTEAAAALVRDPSLAAPFGPVFAVLPQQPSSVVLRFSAALPACPVAVLTGRPRRLLGEEFIDVTAAALGTARPKTSVPASKSTTEIDLVHSFLFEQPDVLARPGRPRSKGPDGTVALEQYPGIQEEIDAAVSWALEEVTERRTPLEEIAIIAPSRDLLPLIVAALECDDKGPRADQVGGDAAGLDAGTAAAAAVPSTISSLPTWELGGLPLTESPSGRLVLQLLRSLHAALEAEQTIPLLPHLRLQADDTRSHLSESEARSLTYECGIIGGTPGDPARALEWPERLKNRAASLDRQLAALKGDTSDQNDARADDDKQKAKWALRRREAERLRLNITAILPALQALTALSSSVRSNASLRTLWAEILDFYRAWCRVPPAPPDATRLIDADLAPVCAHAISERLSGRDAIEHVISRLGEVRYPHGVFGEPRIFIGTPQDTVGLTFQAVRILGAVEGAVPASPREDPIIPDTVRAELQVHMRGKSSHDSCLVPTSSATVLQQTHDVFFAATAAADRLSLSAPRRWIDGTEREIAGVMLEAAVALGRPDRSGESDLVPSLSRLRRDYITKGVEARRRYERSRPVSTHAVLRSIAEGKPLSTPSGVRARAVPPPWVQPEAAGGLFFLSRLRDIAAEHDADALALSDGVLGPELGSSAETLNLPGLQPERAISASALVTLLDCPYRFLLERVLHLEAPVERRPAREIGQPHYGGLVHLVMEKFFREHGERFCRKRGSLADWQRRAADVADRCFDDFLGEYPLLGSGTAEAQRERLRRDAAYLLETEWETHLPLTFVGVEEPFGFPPEAIRLTGGRTLYVRGFIDRVDLKGRQVMVRDIKTGRAKPFRDEPTRPGIDMQLALYSLVAPRLPSVGGARVGFAAYTYPSATGDRERAYASRAKVEELLAEGRAWLELASALLVARSFPHAADSEACTFCPFKPACGDDVTEVSKRKLMTAADGSPEQGFAALQGILDDDDAA